jgi:hypothetical protein
MASNSTTNLLLKSSVQDSTRVKYHRAWERYISTCAQCELAPFPVSTVSLQNFISYEFDRDSSFNSLELYLTGVVFMARQNDVLGQVDHQVICQLKKGFRSLAPNPVSQHPIHLALLRRFGDLIVVKNALDLPSFDRNMVWSSFLCAFFGLMRVSEYTNLCRSCLVVEDVCVRLTLLSTKNSPNESSFVVLGQNNDSLLCPVRHLKRFILTRDKFFPLEFPLFRFINGRAYTANDVNNFIFLLSKLAGVEHLRLSSHSFRIGGATSAAQAGVNAKTIQLMGRWKSDCFLQYIRMNEKDILLAQKSLLTLL